MVKKRLSLIDQDPWLEPCERDIEARHQRYLTRLRQIEADFGSLYDFADAYHYYGFNYDPNLKGWWYREWAPKANELFLFGDFNSWRRFSHPMTQNDFGVWEVFLEEKYYHDLLSHGSKVKVLVVSDKGMQERIPAYIKRVQQDEKSKNFTGQFWNPEEFIWGSTEPFSVDFENPLIYECHIGMAQEREGLGSYNEFTENVLPRVKRLGYNTIQLMAIQEHPYYGSFGYHVSSFFAPSSRFGTPEDLKRLINTAHRMGLAIIMDLVHSHTVKNVNEGLNLFDGSENQYFHSGERGIHPQWDSMLFDYGKTEVLRFLLSNVRYWLEEYHFDGFRFDGVGSMMYYHHGNEVFDDRSKYFTTGVEWDALTYLQLANTLIHQVRKDGIAIAEDVTGMPGLCYPVDEGGIGFDFRLGMGIPDFWIKLLKEQQDEDWNIHEMWGVLNDRLPYVRTVAYCESHDQALVGDKTLAFRLMDKDMYYHMQVNDDNILIARGIALHKLIRLFTITLGGQAYLNFMGNEFGHPEWIDFPREGNDWSFLYARRQWSLVERKDLKYRFLEAFDRAMINLVNQYQLLSENFARQLNMDEVNKTIIFEKCGLIFIFNFHPSNSIPDYQFSLPEPGRYEIILNSDHSDFGGHNRVDNSQKFFTSFDPMNACNRLSIYNVNRCVQVIKKVE